MQNCNRNNGKIQESGYIERVLKHFNCINGQTALAIGWAINTFYMKLGYGIKEV
jgi:hypothetical protein